MSYTYPNVGLKSWDLGSDVFRYQDLDDNWEALDNHDHSSGKGKQIPTNGLTNLAVTESKIANTAVSQGKLTTNAVGASQIIDGSVSASKMATFTWISLPFSSPWTNFDPAYQAGQYVIDHLGFLCLRGYVKNTVAYNFGTGANTTICILPAAARPVLQRDGIAWGQDSTGSYFVLRVIVLTSGEVRLLNSTGGTNNGLAGYTVLDNLRFSLA